MRVLVAGDAMIDRYWHGDITRVSPEAPVPVVTMDREEYSPGGAKNVARNLEAMGVEVREVYSVSYKIDPVIKLRVMARGQQVCRIDWDKPQQAISCEALMEAAEDCDIAILSDYGKGALSNAPACIWRLKNIGKRVFVDPRGTDPHRYRDADLLKPNLAEARALVGEWKSEDELEFKIKKMQRDARIGAVLLTRGADGMTLYAGAVTHIPCDSRQVFDVTGAGDTVIAAFTASVARGLGYAEAARAANRAAGIAVSRPGTAVVKWEEFCA